jgi:hypothetical protein
VPKLGSERGVVLHPIAVAAKCDDVTAMYEPVDQRARHDLIAEDLPTLLEALVRRQHGRRALVAPRHVPGKSVKRRTPNSDRD